MNAQISSIRFVFMLVLALSTLGFAASTALAQQNCRQFQAMVQRSLPSPYS
jgi:hypothetical protein